MAFIQETLINVMVSDTRNTIISFVNNGGKNICVSITNIINVDAEFIVICGHYLVLNSEASSLYKSVYTTTYKEETVYRNNIQCHKIQCGELVDNINYNTTSGEFRELVYKNSKSSVALMLNSVNHLNKIPVTFISLSQSSRCYEFRCGMMTIDQDIHNKYNNGIEVKDILVNIVDENNKIYILPLSCVTFSLNFSINSVMFTLNNGSINTLPPLLSSHNVVSLRSFTCTIDNNNRVKIICIIDIDGRISSYNINNIILSSTNPRSSSKSKNKDKINKTFICKSNSLTIPNGVEVTIMGKYISNTNYYMFKDKNEKVYISTLKGLSKVKINN